MVRQERFCTWEMVMVMNEDMKAVGRVGWLVVRSGGLLVLLFGMKR
jgi:hypothetical protein